jgi:hypothetical protein
MPFPQFPSFNPFSLPQFGGQPSTQKQVIPQVGLNPFAGGNTGGGYSASTQAPGDQLNAFTSQIASGQFQPDLFAPKPAMGVGQNLFVMG